MDIKPEDLCDPRIKIAKVPPYYKKYQDSNCNPEKESWPHLTNKTSDDFIWKRCPDKNQERAETRS